MWMKAPFGKFSGGPQGVRLQGLGRTTFDLTSTPTTTSSPYTSSGPYFAPLDPSAPIVDVMKTAPAYTPPPPQDVYIPPTQMTSDIRATLQPYVDPSAAPPLYVDSGGSSTGPVVVDPFCPTITEYRTASQARGGGLMVVEGGETTVEGASNELLNIGQRLDQMTLAGVSLKKVLVFAAVSVGIVWLTRGRN